MKSLIFLYHKRNENILFKNHRRYSFRDFILFFNLSFYYKIRKVQMVRLLIINELVNVMKIVLHMKFIRVILFNLVLM